MNSLSIMRINLPRPKPWRGKRSLTADDFDGNVTFDIFTCFAAGDVESPDFPLFLGKVETCQFVGDKCFEFTFRLKCQLA